MPVDQKATTVTDRRQSIIDAARRARRPPAGRLPQDQLEDEVRKFLSDATPPAPPDPLTPRHG